MEGLPAVQLAGVGKAYGLFRRRPALEGVSLRIARGECYGLAGPNGAGKTTLIKVMLGLVAPDAGEARLFGVRPEWPEVRRRVGFVPEAAELPPGATPLELVRRWARLRSLPVRPTLEEGEAHLRRLGMAELLERPAHKFSKGEKQRTLLSLAMLGDPELLVLDEPTDGLDPLGRALVRRVIIEETARGKTVFVNSHLLSETERICTRVGILHRGRLVREEVILGPNADAAREGRGTTAVVTAAPIAALPDGVRAGGEKDEPGAVYLVDHEDLPALNRSIDAMRAQGALVVEMRRVRADLEEVFAEVAASVPGTHAPEAPRAIEEGPAPPPSPARGIGAALRVAREIADDLVARKLGHVALAGAALVLGATLLAVRNQIVQGAAATARQLRASGVVDAETVAGFIGRGAAAGAYWAGLAGAIFLAALFAPPLLEPRRSTLLLAQPVSRGDVASGIFLSVTSLTLALYAFFAFILFGALRLLGISLSPRFLLFPLPAAVAFAALYGGVLLATYLFPSGLFAGIVGLASLVALVIAGNSSGAQPGNASGVVGFIHGLIPKLVGLADAAMTVGGGGRLNAFPIASTLAYATALLLFVQVVARRSER